MAVRVLLVAAFAVLYGCGREGSPVEAQEAGINAAGDAQPYASVPVADLSSADLTYADLSGADLGIVMHGASMVGADFRGADLSSAIIHDANLSGTTGKTAAQLDGQADSLKGANHARRPEVRGLAQGQGGRGGS